MTMMKQELQALVQDLATQSRIAEYACSCAEQFQCSATLISSILKTEQQILVGQSKRIYNNGEVINKIQVIERDYNPPWKSHETAYKVKCDCGSKPFYVRKEHLTGQGGRHSHTISCGCSSGDWIFYKFNILTLKY